MTFAQKIVLELRDTEPFARLGQDEQLAIVEAVLDKVETIGGFDLSSTYESDDDDDDDDDQLEWWDDDLDDDEDDDEDDTAGRRHD